MAEELIAMKALPNRSELAKFNFLKPKNIIKNSYIFAF
jgi:hypothetical protein